VVTNPGQLIQFELYDRGAYRQLWEVMGGSRLRRSLALAKRWVKGMPSPPYRPTFLAAWQERWPHQLLQQSVVERLNLHHEYMETARYDAPYRRINDFILQGLLTMPYIATRLENCTLMAASYGIDYRWPLWDVRLVQQYLSTPSLEKVGPQGMGRYLHRRAIEGVVPQRVAWKPSKDMGYGALIERWKDDLPRLAQTAQHLEADLHPTLAELVDRPKWRGQIQTVLEGSNLDQGFIFGFRRGFHALQVLDTWLKDTP
jgi:asparagine synthase (glutamine-hydrolysing)